jgi:hypothetical protein
VELWLSRGSVALSIFDYSDILNLTRLKDNEMLFGPSPMADMYGSGSGSGSLARTKDSEDILRWLRLEGVGLGPHSTPKRRTRTLTPQRKYIQVSNVGVGGVFRGYERQSASPYGDVQITPISKTLGLPS